MQLFYVYVSFYLYFVRKWQNKAVQSIIKILSKKFSFHKRVERAHPTIVKLSIKDFL